MYVGIVVALVGKIPMDMMAARLVVVIHIKKIVP
jgi:hypothetical protein